MGATATLRYGPDRSPDLPSAGLAADVPTLLLAEHAEVVVFGDWYWRSPDSSTVGVAHTLHRMLTVAPQHLSDLHDGIAGAARYHRRIPRPPLPVLRAYLASQPRYTLTGDTAALSPDTPAAELSRTDRAVVAAFADARERTLAELVEAAIAAGIRPPGAQPLVLRNPLIADTRYGRYRLRAAAHTERPATP